MRERIRVGFVGVRRASSFFAAFRAQPRVEIVALCDVDEGALAAAGMAEGVSRLYTAYEQMLDGAALDAVVLGTPMPFHAPQAIAALERDIHVLSEVTAAVSVEECRALVAAAKRSRAVYMMAENYTYMKPNVLVRELVRRGLFGEVYYAEGEYIHELKELNEVTPWRRRWQTGVDGITYGTHSLGPILQWMPGDRVVRVCCEGSGHHYRDPRGDYYENQDSCVMLAKTARGEAARMGCEAARMGCGLIKIRVDMLSNRPHAMTNYQLQGTRGCYESARSAGEHHKIWLADLCPDMNTWLDLADLEADYLEPKACPELHPFDKLRASSERSRRTVEGTPYGPEVWRHPPEEAMAKRTSRAGHGGGDYFEVMDFVRSILDGTPPLIGIHEAMDMTLPGLLSQASVAAGGAWMEVPDSRTW